MTDEKAIKACFLFHAKKILQKFFQVFVRNIYSMHFYPQGMHIYFFEVVKIPLIYESIVVLNFIYVFKFTVYIHYKM